jgi:hypothetical protein
MERLKALKAPQSEEDDEISEITTDVKIHLGIVKGANGVRVTADNYVWGTDLMLDIKGGARKNAARTLANLAKGNCKCIETPFSAHQCVATHS